MPSSVMDNHGPYHGRGASDRGDPHARRPGAAGQPSLLAHLLWTHLPEARIAIADAGPKGEEALTIDVAVDGFRTRLAWSAKQGFGLFLGEAREGARPDEIYASPQLAATRLRAMIEGFRAGAAPAAMNISEVRKLLGCRQRDVAARLSVQQASISRFEGRRNPTLGALRAVVEAIGGELEVRIRSASIDVPIILPEPSRDD